MNKDIAYLVAKEYIELKKLDRRNGLLDYLEKVEIAGGVGMFVWSNKNASINGCYKPIWVKFYLDFSDEIRDELTEDEIGRRLPDCLENYYNGLRKEVERLKNKSVN